MKFESYYCFNLIFHIMSSFCLPPHPLPLHLSPLHFGYLVDFVVTISELRLRLALLSVQNTIIGSMALEFWHSLEFSISFWFMICVQGVAQILIFPSREFLFGLLLLYYTQNLECPISDFHTLAIHTFLLNSNRIDAPKIDRKKNQFCLTIFGVNLMSIYLSSNRIMTIKCQIMHSFSTHTNTMTDEEN